MSELSRKQEKVLIDLLNGLSITNAAKLNGISETTIYKWLNDESFKREYRRLRRESVEESLSILQQTAKEAAETLRRNLNCGKPEVETRTAQIVIDNAVKAVELTDIVERLEILENATEK